MIARHILIAIALAFSGAMLLSPAPPHAAVEVVDTAEGAREICYSEINRYRRSVGLQALTPAPRDREHCAAAAARKSHDSQTAHAGAFSCGEDAQNECQGWGHGYHGDPRDIVRTCLKHMWDEGPGPWNEGHGHYINMTGDYKIVACGFYVTQSNHVTVEINFYH
jgi:hypothetical protein